MTKYNTKKALLFKKEIDNLFLKFGSQGWWPRVVRNGNGLSVKHGISSLDKLFLKSSDLLWEVVLGALLTQNTTWVNVEKALFNLASNNTLSLSSIVKLSDNELETLIKPAGYFRQKTKKIKIAGDFFSSLDLKCFNKLSLEKKRQKILNLWGIGPETADTILLYGLLEPVFVVDAYTRRFLFNLDGDQDWLKVDYSVVQLFCSKALLNKSVSNQQLVIQFQEAHALIVKWAKDRK